MTSSPWRAASRQTPASAVIFRLPAMRLVSTWFVPPLKLCGDNAAMIGCQAYYEYLRGAHAGSELNAWANMEISEVPFYGHA